MIGDLFLGLGVPSTYNGSPDGITFPLAAFHLYFPFRCCRSRPSEEYHRRPGLHPEHISCLTCLSLGFCLASPLISFVTMIYAALSFRAFLQRRNTIDELFTNGPSISKAHYLRHMCFSPIPFLLMFPLHPFRPCRHHHSWATTVNILGEHPL